jgi:hypothetical protein
MMRHYIKSIGRLMAQFHIFRHWNFPSARDGGKPPAITPESNGATNGTQALEGVTHPSALRRQRSAFGDARRRTLAMVRTTRKRRGITCYVLAILIEKFPLAQLCPSACRGLFRPDRHQCTRLFVDLAKWLQISDICAITMPMLNVGNAMGTMRSGSEGGGLRPEQIATRRAGGKNRGRPRALVIAPRALPRNHPGPIFY